MSFFIVKHIDEFEEVFSSEKVKISELHNYTRTYRKTEYELSNYYLTLFSAPPKIKESEFIIEIKLKKEDSLIEVGENTFLFPRCINIRKNLIYSVLFKNEEIANIFINRVKFSKTIKNPESVIEKITTTKEEHIVNFIPIDKENPLLNSELEITNFEEYLKGAVYYCALGNHQSLSPSKKIEANIDVSNKLIHIREQMENTNKYYKAVQKVINNEIRNCSNEAINLIYKSNSSFIIDEHGDVEFRQRNDERLDNDMFATILNQLLLRKTRSLKECYIQIGEYLVSHSKSKKVLAEFRILYDIVINSNLKHDPLDIKSEMLLALLVASICDSDIRRINEMAIKYRIDKRPEVYIFSGAILGYSRFSRQYQNIIEANIITQELISNELQQIDDFVENYYEKLTYIELEKYRKSNVINRIRKRQIYNDLEKLRITNLSKDITQIRINSSYNSYRIVLNKRKTLNFDRKLEKLNLKKAFSRTSEYNSLSIVNENGGRLTDIEFFNIKNEVRNIKI